MFLSFRLTIQKSKQMKIIQLVFILTISASSILLAQPQIYFPNGTIQDWGKVKPIDHPLNARIPIKNIGTDTLYITNVQPTCGCTTAPLEKNKLAPGEETVIFVTLSIRNYEGKITKTINVNSNDKKNSLVILELQADIVREVFVSPGNFVSFIDAEVGKNVLQTLSIDNKSDRNVKLKIAEITPPGLKLNLKDGQIIQKGKSFPLEINYNPTKSGVIKGKITIITDHPDYPEIPIFIYGNIKKSPIFIEH